MKNLLNRATCPAKSYWAKQNLGFRDTLSGMTKKVMKDFFTQHTFSDLTEQEIFLNALSPLEKYYKTVFEREDYEDEIMERYKRTYLEVFTNSTFFQISKATCAKITINDAEVFVSFDGVFESKSEGFIMPVKVVDGSSPYGATAKSKDFFASQPEYYLMYKAAQELYPNKWIVPAIIYTKPKTSKKQYTQLDFIQAYDYSDGTGCNQENNLYFLKTKEECEMLSKNDVNAENKTCDETKCDMCPFNKICKFEDYQQIKSEIVEEIKKSSGSKFKLTPAQEEVVNHFEGEARVLAGAGSGKTTCLINRVINMIELGKAKPSDFLMITFTEKGGREMREKLRYWLDEKKLDVNGNFTIETFNSFGQKIIEKEYQKLGFTEKPYLIDDVLGYDIIIELSNNGYRIPGISYARPFSKFFGRKGGIASIYSAVQLYKGEEYVDRHGYIEDKKFFKELNISVDNIEYFYKLVDAYNEKLREENLIDYADQITFALQLLNDDSVLKRFNYKHIIIDEFQDTSKKQMEIIQKLYKKSNGRSLLVCGDDAQAIFGFRGVGPENIIGFDKYYPEAKDIYMVDNFRSTNQIVGLANKVIKLNKNQIDKALIAHKDGKNVVYVNNNSAVKDYTTSIVDKVEEALKTHLPKDIAVLCGTRAELLAVRRLLNEKGICSSLSISNRYVDDSAIIGLIGLCSWIDDPAYLMGLTLYQSSINYDVVKNSFNIKEMVEELAIRTKIDINGMDDSQLYEWIVNVKIPAITRTEALDEITAIFKERFTTYSEIKDYLNKLSLYDSEKSCEVDDNTYNAVTVSTIHSSKGREWDVVIVSDYKMNTVTNGVILYDDVVQLEFDEERIRLLYVAITRAKKELYMVQNTNSDMLDELDNVMDVGQFRSRYHYKAKIINADGSTYKKPTKPKK